MQSASRHSDPDAVRGLLATAEQHGYDGAAEHYRETLAALEADDSDGNDDASADSDSSTAEDEAALSADERADLESHRDQAEKLGMGGMADHYEQQLDSPTDG